MTYNNVSYPRPTVWLIPEAFVEHKGEEYRFWAEWDGRDGQVTYEFVGGEPPEDGFDWEQFESDVKLMLEDYTVFCDENNVDEEPFKVGDLPTPVGRG